MSTPDSSVELRHHVDAALGGAYDRAFRILDTLRCAQVPAQRAHDPERPTRLRRVLDHELDRLGPGPDRRAGRWMS